MAITSALFLTMLDRIAAASSVDALAALHREARAHGFDERVSFLELMIDVKLARLVRLRCRDAGEARTA